MQLEEKKALTLGNNSGILWESKISNGERGDVSKAEKTYVSRGDCLWKFFSS